MEKKHQTLVQDYQQRFDSIKGKYEVELSNKDRVIQQMQMENEFLRSKFDKIKDVFDYQRPRGESIELMNIQVNEDSFKKIHELQPIAMTIDSEDTIGGFSANQSNV